MEYKKLWIALAVVLVASFSGAGRSGISQAFTMGRRRPRKW